MNPRDFFKELIANGSGKAPGTLSSELKTKYGAGLGLKDVVALRKAHDGGTYDQVAQSVFAGFEKRAEAKLAQASQRRPRAKAGRPAASKGLKKRSRTRAPKPRVAKARGDRRGERDIRRGRRHLDQFHVMFDEMPQHLVVAYRQGHIEDYRFKAKGDAKECISRLVSEGVSPAVIGYYTRANFDLSVDISVG